VDGVVFLPLYWVDRWIWDTVSTPAVLVPWFVVDSSSFVLYSVLLHGCFGQTLGKRLMGVKVFDVSGSKLSLKQAVLRDSVYIALVVYGLIIDLPTVAKGQNPYSSATELSVALLVSLYASLGWFALELVTMLANSKRRAIHDFIARSVVMRVDALHESTDGQLSHA